MTDTNTIQPNIEAEQAILGVLLLGHIDPELNEKLSESDFLDSRHANIYKGIIAVRDDDGLSDAFAVTTWLDDNGLSEKCGGYEYIIDITDAAVNPKRIRHHVAEVKKRSIKKAFSSAGSKIMALAASNDVDSMDELVSKSSILLDEVASITEFQEEDRTLKQILEAAIQDIDDAFNKRAVSSGINTGLVDLDVITGGFKKHQLILVAGTPASGKTTLVTNVMERSALTNKGAHVIFSLEMSSEEIVTKMITSLSGVNARKIDSGDLGDEDWPLIVLAVEKIKDMNFHVYDKGAISTSFMRSKLSSIKKKHGEIACIAVDYIQIMGGEKAESETVKVSTISGQLKAIAKDYNCPMIALSQLNRSYAARQDQRPQQSDLKQSGALEADADKIIMLYRDDDDEKTQNGVTEMIVRKNRRGTKGTAKVLFQGRYSRFVDIQPEFISQN